MITRNQNPFAIRENLATVSGYARLAEEGKNYWLAAPGERINYHLSREKMRLIFFFVIFCLFFIFGRLFYLQIVAGAKYNLYAEGNRLRAKIIKAERGIIYDRFNRPLVSNMPNYALYFVPADLPKSFDEQTALAGKVAGPIGQGKEEIEKIFNSADSESYDPILLAENLSAEMAITFRAIEDDLPGIELKIEPRREYLEGSGFSHLLGYVGQINPAELESSAGQGYNQQDSLGKDGIEKYYEDILRGQDGLEEVEVDASGKPKKILNRSEPVAGSHIILSVDMDLQKKLTDSLARAIKNSSSSGSGAAIALDPTTGEILALVSLPDFDNNFFSAGINQDAYENYLADPEKPLFNRAIAGTYPPGSTIKPAIALAGLEDKIIDEHKTFLSTGGLTINKWFFPDWQAGGHGPTNIIKALSESVNTYFYYLGGGYGNFTGLGVDKIIAYLSKLHLGESLGIDLPGEAKGFLPSKIWKETYKGESWYIGDTYHLAIGQGDILVTPLQVAAYTAAIANKGTLYRPHLLKTTSSKLKPNAIAPTEADFILNNKIGQTENIEIVRRGLRATVISGSARSFGTLSVAAAGKTGTAQVGGRKPTHAWFTGFAPYESPKIVLTILIENGGEGSAVAVPVFREVIDWYFSEQ